MGEVYSTIMEDSPTLKCYKHIVLQALQSAVGAPPTLKCSKHIIPQALQSAVGASPTLKCSKHRTYKAMKAPTADCNACRIMWTYSKYNDEFDNNLMDN